MRLFGGIKDTYKKSEAAVVVQNLLEMQQKSGLFDSDPASSATSLVDAVWTKNPHIFDGRFGQRPHKISLAASAFSNAIEVLEVGNPNSDCFTMCLPVAYERHSAAGNAERKMTLLLTKEDK